MAFLVMNDRSAQCVKCFALLVGFWLGGALVVVAQDPDSIRQQVQKDLEVAFEEFADDDDATTEQLSQLLQDLAANPINLNRATIDELMVIPVMTLPLAKAIVDYRRNVKPFESVKELEKIPGIGAATRYRFEPYLTIGPSGLANTDLIFDSRFWTNGGRVESITRVQQVFQTQRGFQIKDSTRSRFLGVEPKLYQRTGYRSRHLSLNITQENDSGEPLNYPQTDFISGHLAIKDVGRLNELVIGDYSATFGQGLVLFNGGAFGKGRNVISSATRTSRGVRAYRSAEENRFFRGVGFTWGRKLKISGMYSNRKWSATQVAIDTVNFPSFAGLNRTPNERARKDNLGVQTIAGRVSYETNYFIIGAQAYQTEFDQFIQRRSGSATVFDFQGETSSAASVDFRGFYQNITVFGEVAQSRNQAWAYMGGVNIEIAPRTDLTMVHRNYDKDYQTIYGSAFGEQSGFPANEIGTYIGMRHRVNNWLELSGYYDQYEFPNARFGVEQPSEGWDVLLNAEVKINRQTSFYLLGRSEQKDTEFEFFDDFNRPQRAIDQQLRRSLRFNLEHNVSKTFRLRSRVEGVAFDAPGEDTEFGFIMFQDVRFIFNRKWKFDTRFTYFDTDSFDTRVFQFENDLLFVMTNTVLSGRGERFYILTEYEPTEWLEIWVKYDITRFDDRQVISSGLTEIQGNVRSRIGAQVRVRF